MKYYELTFNQTLFCIVYLRKIHKFFKNKAQVKIHVSFKIRYS